MLGFSLLKSISKIVGSNQKILDEQKKVETLKKENSVLNKELQFAQSPQFIESQARDKLGLAKKGEMVVVLPDEKILKSLAPKMPIEKKIELDPVWKKWLKLFM